MSSQLSRRDFLKMSSLGAASILAAPNVRLQFSAQEPGADILVVIFLRGGMDTLNAVPPLEGEDRREYEEARPAIKIPASELSRLDDRFGLHPALAPLYELYQAGQLAVIQSTGLPVDTRSHFDAQEYMELGTPGSKSIASGWITRAFAGVDPDGLLPVLGIPVQPTALLKQFETVTLSEPGDLAQWDNGYLAEQQQVLRSLYAGAGALRQSGLRTLDVVQSVSTWMEGEYRPASGARYPEDEFGRSLAAVARIARLELGLRVAAVDLGGWDTHEDQNDGSGGYFADRLASLAAGLAAFYRDLQDQARGVAVVCMSEFGRRLAQNDSRGTDHGHGSLMFALGQGVNGGQVYGDWPGLASEKLYDRADVAVTTDYRQVLAELLARRLHNPPLEQVFPGFQPGPELGVFR